MANLVSYAKQKWEDAKTAITAARLNNMEDGISNCATQINALGDSVSLRIAVDASLKSAKLIHANDSVVLQAVVNDAGEYYNIWFGKSGVRMTHALSQSGTPSEIGNVAWDK